MRSATFGVVIFAACLADVPAAGVSSDAQFASSYDLKSAAAYLDQRAAWWIHWPGAARDHGTFCVSCHTALPYAIARPALRSALGEPALTSAEEMLRSSVTKRVRLWKEVKPFYADESDGPYKSTQSRGTEAVLNALILASSDAHAGRLSHDTRTAFDNMWALQRISGKMSGSWPWLQFNNEPWEAHDSAYYGAALAAVAVGVTPEDYRSANGIQKNLVALRDYLNREFSEQSPINQVVLLWASAKWPGLLSPQRRDHIVSDVMGDQLASGGWSLAPLVWTWRDWSLISLAKLWRSEAPPLGRTADAYATGLITFALEQAGVPHDNSHLRLALDWLAHNQNKARGMWPSYSVNRKHNPSSDTGLFMSDAGTAFAVLALTNAQEESPSPREAHRQAGAFLKVQ